MTRSTATYVCLAMLAVLPGCGTMCNVAGVEAPLIPAAVQPAPFGGVYRDCHWFGEIATGVPTMPERLSGCAFCLLDAPFSLAADVLTLPIVPFLSPPHDLIEHFRRTASSNDEHVAAEQAKGP